MKCSSDIMEVREPSRNIKNVISKIFIKVACENKCVLRLSDINCHICPSRINEEEVYQTTKCCDYLNKYMDLLVEYNNLIQKSKEDTRMLNSSEVNNELNEGKDNISVDESTENNIIIKVNEKRIKLKRKRKINDPNKISHCVHIKSPYYFLFKCCPETLYFCEMCHEINTGHNSHSIISHLCKICKKNNSKIQRHCTSCNSFLWRAKIY
jgi:hypothetical protein